MEIMLEQLPEWAKEQKRATLVPKTKKIRKQWEKLKKTRRKFPRRSQRREPFINPKFGHSPAPHDSTWCGDNPNHISDASRIKDLDVVENNIYSEYYDELR